MISIFISRILKTSWQRQTEKYFLRYLWRKSPKSEEKMRKKIVVWKEKLWKFIPWANQRLHTDSEQRGEKKKTVKNLEIYMHLSHKSRKISFAAAFWYKQNYTWECCSSQCKKLWELSLHLLYRCTKKSFMLGRRYLTLGRSLCQVSGTLIRN